MPAFNQEQIWAAQLAKNRSSVRPADTTDWTLKAASIVRDMSQTKKNLKAALLSQDAKKIESLLGLLITLRAEQLRYTIQQYRHTTPKEKPEDIAHMVMAYKKDCTRLIQQVSKAHS